MAQSHKSDNGAAFGDLLRRLGSSQRAIDRFWDVFVRPALNLSTEEAGADFGTFTVRTALLGEKGASDLVLPVAPLGEMHGGAAGRVLRGGAEIRLDARHVDRRARVSVESGEPDAATRSSSRSRRRRARACSASPRRRSTTRRS